MGQNKTVYFIGKLNVDIFGNSFDITQLGNTKDNGTGGVGVTMGGAAFNVHRAFSTLSRIYDDQYNTKIITNVGNPPEAITFEKFEEGLLVEAANAIFVPRLLEYYDIDYHDLLKDKQGPGVAVSIVEGYSGGRHITKQIQPLINTFNEASGACWRDDFGRVLKGGDMAFIDPASPFLAARAAQACGDLDIPYLTDYGMKKWLNGPAGECVICVLKGARAIAVPGDAVLREMEHGKENPGILLSLLCRNGVYWDRDKKIGDPRTVFMSDGIKPVKFFHDDGLRPYPDFSYDKTGKINVDVVGNPINVNGVGDTRDGAYLFYTMRGDDPGTALRKATKVASIRTQYLEEEWEHNFYKHVRYDPLFKEDLPDMEEALGIEPSGDDVESGEDRIIELC